jgi:NAD(P)H-hydrate repair Nnr-like enzyme with NAD(P)H-hydrate dehydratase domain
MQPGSLPPFIRQDDQPLFPKVLYNRPVTRNGAGRLLVVGGHAGEFSLPTTIHQLALAAGVGECRVALPDTLAKLLGGAPGTAFLASSPSGSLGTEALGRLLSLSEEADAVAIGASLSGNSNTAILIEKFITELERPYSLFDQGLSAVQHHISVVTTNPDALLIMTMTEVFKLSGQLGIAIHIRDGAGLMNKLEIIHNLATAIQAQIVVYGTEIVIAAGEELIVTPINYRLSLVPAIFYAVLTTFWLQNPADRRAGLATAAYIIRTCSQNLGHTDRPSVGALANALETARRHDDFS